jgi:hypothetical protein
MSDVQAATLPSRRTFGILRSLAALACVFGVKHANAEDGRASAPISSPLPALGMSPEAPAVPPAPGGRAPSFGAPSEEQEWTFRIGGRVSGWQSAGLGREPSDRSYAGIPLHVPPRTAGRGAFYAGGAGALFFAYGNGVLSANVTLEAGFGGVEHEGYHNPQHGPSMRNAYLYFTPAELGKLKLRFQVGAFNASYGAPGPWGWGLLGPLIGVHGYGETTVAEYDVSSNVRLYLEHGVAVSPQVPQGFPRLTYTGWAEEGITTLVQHGHAGFSYQNRLSLKAHYAQARGIDERTWMADQAESATPDTHHDGRMDVYVLEGHLQMDRFGQLGLSGAFWRFRHGFQVHDGIGWGLDWTAGGREMGNKYLGPNSRGHGELAALALEYDVSLARIVRHPEAFNGNGPDVRVALAFNHAWTVDTRDPDFHGATGYMLGADVEYVILPWLSALVRVFGESRDVARLTFTGRYLDASGSESPAGAAEYLHSRGRWSAFNLTPGLAFHTDWLSTDRIELGYSRYFYSELADHNSARPLDRDVVTLGARLTF